MPFRILTVCTGNVCRSPMAERLLQAGLDSLSPGDFLVSSAGTGALTGSGIEPRVEGFIRIFGADPDGFRSRQVTGTILEGPDLVLTMTREHRSAVTQMSPVLLRRTFTLRELARLLPRVDGGTGGTEPPLRWQAAVSRAVRLRSVHPGGAELDDVVDPYGHGDELYQRMVREIVPAVEALLDWERRYG